MRVSCNQKVAHVNRIGDVTFDGVDGIQEVLHLAGCITDEYGLEVVSVLQPVTDTGRYGEYILQHRSIFNTYHIIAGAGLDIVAGQHLSECFGFLLVGASYGKVGKTVHGHFLCMTGTTNHCQILLRYVIFLIEVV